MKIIFFPHCNEQCFTDESICVLGFFINLLSQSEISHPLALFGKKDYHTDYD